MTVKRIIPCLDVRGGRVVKGVQFVNLRDAGDPVELAAVYDREGADELVFLDITASPKERDITLAMLRRTAEKVSIPLTVGGGLRTVDDVGRVLAAGADKVSISSAAIRDPDLIARAADRYGRAGLVIAIDAKRTAPGRWEVFSGGGRSPTGMDVLAWARRVESLGAGEILLTSMDRDGTGDGYDIELTRSVSDAVDIPVIASGGVGTMEHIAAGLTAGGAAGALAASIFHFGTCSIRQVKKYLRERGIPVRL